MLNKIIIQYRSGAYAVLHGICSFTTSENTFTANFKHRPHLKISSVSIPKDTIENMKIISE